MKRGPEKPASTPALYSAIGSERTIAVCRSSTWRNCRSASSFSWRITQVLFLQEALERRLALDFHAHAIQVHQHRDLGTQDDWIDRLEHVVDRTHRVSSRDVLVVAIDGADENDGNVSRAFATANQLGGHVTVQAGHIGIEQNHARIPLATGSAAHPRRRPLPLPSLRARPTPATGRIDCSARHRRSGCVAASATPASASRVRRRSPLGASSSCGPMACASLFKRAAATRASSKRADRHRPAWKCIPKHRLRCIFRGRPSWPWR